jgi:hypothetical protein
VLPSLLRNSLSACGSERSRTMCASPSRARWTSAPLLMVARRRARGLRCAPRRGSLPPRCGRSRPAWNRSAGPPSPRSRPSRSLRPPHRRSTANRSRAARAAGAPPAGGVARSCGRARRGRSTHPGASARVAGTTAPTPGPCLRPAGSRSFPCAPPPASPAPLPGRPRRRCWCSTSTGARRQGSPHTRRRPRASRTAGCGCAGQSRPRWSALAAAGRRAPDRPARLRLCARPLRTPPAPDPRASSQAAPTCPRGSPDLGAVDVS